MTDRLDLGVAEFRSVAGARPAWARLLPQRLTMTSHHVATSSSGDHLLTCTPSIRRNVRRGEHALGGPLGDGWALSRRSFERFHLIDPAQREVAQVRGRSLRPSTGMRRSIELREGDEILLTVVEEAPRSTITTALRGLRGQVVAEWRHDDRIHVEVWESKARMSWDRDMGVDNRLAIVLGLVAWRLTLPADF